MKEDMSDLQGCDEFEGEQVLLMPLITDESMTFWSLLLFEKIKVKIGFSLIFLKNEKPCYVVCTHKETAGILWKSLDELLPAFNALQTHDKLKHLSGQRKKCILQ